jgi:hypothetical protein
MDFIKDIFYACSIRIMLRRLIHKVTYINIEDSPFRVGYYVINAADVFDRNETISWLEKKITVDGWCTYWTIVYEVGSAISHYRFKADSHKCESIQSIYDCYIEDLNKKEFMKSEAGQALQKTHKENKVKIDLRK